MNTKIPITFHCQKLDSKKPGVFNNKNTISPQPPFCFHCIPSIIRNNLPTKHMYNLLRFSDKTIEHEVSSIKARHSV